MRISALILAAGKGSRMGTPKLMLEVNEKSFINVIIDKVRNAGIKDIYCTVSGDTFEWAGKNIEHCKIVINPEPDKGMISSVYYGFKQIQNADYVMIIPVDHPFVEIDTFKILLLESERKEGLIIKPRYKGKSGHPVIVPYNLMKDFDEKNLCYGLDEIISKSDFNQIFIDVNDIGILKNVNTKEDLQNR